jgi:hypothetical protein
MAKTKLELTYKGVDYCLEFTAETIKELERTGKVKFGKLDDQALTVTEELFYGTFDANHKDVKRKLRQEIYHELAEQDEDGEELAKVLAEMVDEAIDSLKPSGNVSWKKTH